MNHKKLFLTLILSLKSKGKGLQSRQAFTLVELIVVITILAILGTIAFISLQGYSASSRDSVRISDVSNMKTSLELFHLNSGKYPSPDDFATVSYDSEDLWHQGTFGSDVVSQVSRNMSEIPTDPLTEIEYVYSITNNKNEFQILTLLESDIAYNSNINQPHPNPLPLGEGIVAISQTNAATLSVTPKIDGNYNGVFIKTQNYIIPVPSIINTEIEGANLTLNNTNIKSQVTNLGKNIPNIGNVNYNTGALTGLELIEILVPPVDASPTIKASVITSIQEAYTGCIDLANNDIYKYILSISGETELASVFDTIVLNKNTAVAAIIPTNCEFNGETVLHSTSVTAYETTSVSYGNTCITEQRTCTNGTLSGSYTFSTCIPDGATGTFTLSQTSVTQGTSVTITNTCSTPPTNYTSSNTSVATVTGTTITTLTAGTTNITPTNGACADNASKILTVTAPTSCTTGLTEITLSNGQTWSCMNLGATTVRDGTTQPTNCGGVSTTNCNSSLTWLGNYYQWGRNDTGWTNGQVASPYLYGWESQNDTRWGGSTSDTTTSDGVGTTAIGRQGPCPSGWHVPSVKDWQTACNTILGTTCTNGMAYNSLIATKLRLPFAGIRNRSNGYYYFQSTVSDYLSSSPYSSNSYYLHFNQSNIEPDRNAYRAFGFSVRCLKN